MVRAVFLFPILVCLVSEHFSSAKDISVKRLDKSHPNKKLPHEEKHKTVLFKGGHNPQSRDYLQRCQIICPIGLPLPPNCNGGSNHPTAPINNHTTPSPSTTASTTEQESSTETEESSEETDTDTDTISPTTNSTAPNRNITSRLNKPVKHQIFRIAASNIPRHTSGKDRGDRKGTYHRLTGRQKHILLKQLNLGNSNGKKAYKFRHINPYQCQVVCEYEQEIPSIAQQITLNEEGGEDDGDGYEEGEDTPIEITIKPIVPQNNVIAGVRPVGNVDFIGLDDFGPSADSFGDPSLFLEDKKARKKTERAHLKKKNVSAEKKSNLHTVIPRS